MIHHFRKLPCSKMSSNVFRGSITLMQNSVIDLESQQRVQFDQCKAKKRKILSHFFSMVYANATLDLPMYLNAQRDKNHARQGFLVFRWNGVTTTTTTEGKTRTTSFSLETGIAATFKMKPEKHQMLASLMKRLLETLFVSPPPTNIEDETEKESVSDKMIFKQV